MAKSTPDPTRTAMVLKEGFCWNPLRNYPRNEQCFCGSKLKFKKCCVNKLASAIPGKDLKSIVKALKERNSVEKTQ